jgi:uncharacterized protein YlzI (FlbEa/FlbD family)
MLARNLAALALSLIELHAADGGRIFLNPAEIASVREPRGTSQHHWATSVHCVVGMANGGQVAVTESCDEVRQRLP